ncbi:MAG: hypothetical protein COA78_29810 [Blastopirellula sp.]|nr:MAG: hypothetical protein COA78_29810 [Blastopirellula sp.]
MRMDFKAALLAVGMMVSGSAIAGAQEATEYYEDAGNVSYTSTIADDAAACGDVAACGGACDTGCNSCGSGCGLLSWPCCGHGDAWTLFPENCCGIKIGGHLSAGYYGNARGRNTQTGNGPLGFNNNAQNVVLNQVWLYAEKEADAETYCFDLGYRVDGMFGADGPDTQAFSHGNRDVWDNRWDSGSFMGGAIPQAYLTAAWGNWNVKAGHFYTTIGYEVVPATGNFFYSHAYTMVYAEPFTHTGVLAEYNGLENMTVYGGWTNGWDAAFDTYEGGSTFLGGVSMDLTDRTSMTWMVNIGDWGSQNDGNIFMNSLVFDVDLGCGLNYIFQTDLGNNTNITGEQTYWYGANQYLLKEINDCWSVGVRAEWFCDEDGARIAATGPGNYYAATFGVNWKPNANITVRPEVRFDKFDDIGAGGGTPFADGNHDDIMFYGLDAIFTF